MAARVVAQIRRHSGSCAFCLRAGFRLRTRGADRLVRRPTACTCIRHAKNRSAHRRNRGRARGAAAQSGSPASRRGRLRKDFFRSRSETQSSWRSPAPGRGEGGLAGGEADPWLRIRGLAPPMPSARPAIFTKKCTAPAATCGPGSRSVTPIFMPMRACDRRRAGELAFSFPCELASMAYVLYAPSAASPCTHAVRQSDLRHLSSQAAEDRRPGQHGVHTTSRLRWRQHVRQPSWGCAAESVSPLPPTRQGLTA